MGTHMKTTIELSDSLLHSAKLLASKNKTTLRALMEEGLRRVLSDTQAQTQPAFKLKNASVHDGSALITEPHKWQQLEDEHLTSGLRK
ncbi:MAG: hypothetical protein RL497_2696 [Pseudomonadota bacterium]|jgi:predicted transcriptional regulator